MAEDLQAIESLMATGALRAAQDECKRFLQQHPTHAAAHELMGDILYARQLWEEAAQWYDLALQLAKSEKLRIKRADAYQRARQARRGPEPTLVDDTESPSRMIWLAVAAAAMLLVIVIVIASIAGGRDAERTAQTLADDSLPPARSPALTRPSRVRGSGQTDAPTPSRPPAATSRQRPQAQELSEEHWAAEPLDRIPPRRPISRSPDAQRTPEPFTDHDEAVIRAVSSLSWDANRPMTGQVSAMVDPFTGYAVVRVLVPRGLVSEDLQVTVVRQAYRVAVSVFQANEIITAMTVQMVRDTDTGERVLLFRGNTTRRALQRVETRSPDFDLLWNHVFTAVRWNPLAGPEASGVTEGSFQEG